jgi:ABC-type branched-subunit amino acid transport system ATPase component
MKRIIPAFAIIFMSLFVATSSFAQSDPAARQAEMKQKLMTDLKMTSVQADSVVAINSSYMPQRREIFQNQSLSQDEKMSKMKSITAEADKRIQPILGDSLFKQYQDWRMKNMQQMRGGRSGNN